jgi:hypothetical protein
MSNGWREKNVAVRIVEVVVSTPLSTDSPNWLSPEK